MSLVADIRPLTTHLYARLTGEFDLKGFKDAYARVTDAAHQHRLLKILLDAREITGDISDAERYELSMFYAEHRAQALLDGKTVGYWMAIVALPPIAHPQKIGAREMRRRGLPADLFGNLEDAMKWLELETGPG